MRFTIFLLKGEAWAFRQGKGNGQESHRCHDLEGTAADLGYTRFIQKVPGLLLLLKYLVSDTNKNHTEER